MKKCPKCGEVNTKRYGNSKNFYKCECGYIGEYPRKKPKPKKEKEVYENSCGDDLLDYIHSQW